ncbi:MAG: ferric reductase-like transmembrane domain-containing protein [Chloroflexota bacterium]|nr:ferric reductase-like transmembrane domain-containing protein [Chloroflexota bacterium]
MATTHFFWYLARSAGFLAYTFAWGSVVWGLLMTTRYLPRADRATLYILHRLLGLGSLLLLVIHLYALYLDPWAKFSPQDLFIPFHANYRPFWMSCGIVMAYLLVVIAVSSLLLSRLPVVVWRGLHYLSFLTFALGLAHGIGSGTDSPRMWALAWYTLTGATVVGLCVNRVIWGRQAARKVSGRVAIRQIDPRTHALRGLQAAIASSAQRPGAKGGASAAVRVVQETGASLAPPTGAAVRYAVPAQGIKRIAHEQRNAAVPMDTAAATPRARAMVERGNATGTRDQRIPRIARRRVQ